MNLKSGFSGAVELFAVAHRTPDGVAYLGESLFGTEADARRHVAEMPAYYRENKDERSAKAWERGTHVVCSAVVTVPEGWEEMPL